MRQRNHRGAVELIRATDALGQAADPEQALDRKTADRNDQLRPQDLEFPAAPERAQLLLARSRRPVAASRSRPSRIAPCDRGAVERRIELVLLEAEPAAQGLAGTAAPRAALLALDDARCLSIHVRTLVEVHVAHRQRRGGITRLDAGPTDGEVPLQRSERAVRAAAPCHARTTTNQ